MLAEQALAPVTNFRPSRYIPLCIIIFGFLYLLISAGSDTTGVSYLYALGLLQAAPLLLGFVRGKFCYLDFLLFNHFMTFTVVRLSAMSNLEQSTTIPPDVILAIEVLAKATCLIILGHSIARYIFLRRYFESASYEKLNLAPMRHLLVLGGTLMLPFVIHDLPGGLLVPVMAGASCGFILIFTSQVPLAPKRETWARVLLFLSAIQYFLVTGFMSMLAQYAGISFVNICMRRKFVYGIPLFCFVLFLSAVQSVKNDYRDYLRMSEGVPPLERVAFLAELIKTSYGQKEEEVEDDLRDKQLAQGFSRVGDNSLEVVLAQTPSVVPYWNGETYAVIPFMFIPRFMWPEKPSRDFWNKYGRTYGIITPDDFETAVGVGFLAEAYMNYGYMGIYLLAVCFGFFVAFLEKASTLFMGVPSLLAYIVFLLPVLPYATDLGSMLSSIFAATAIMLMLRLFLKANNTRDAYGSATDAAR